VSSPEFSFWRFCPDRDVVVMQVDPLFAGMIDVFALFMNLAGDGVGDEIERDPGLGCGSAYRHFACSRSSSTVSL
jgi:hypothetical protein